MVTASSMATRSSLELMLDKLQQPEQQHAHSPPPLPVRPVSRARLPRPRPRPRPPEMMKKQDIEPLHQGVIAESDGVAAQFHHFLKKVKRN